MKIDRTGKYFRLSNEVIAKLSKLSVVKGKNRTKVIEELIIREFCIYRKEAERDRDTM